MPGDLTKLGTALTLAFAASFVGLLVELVYVLWRRRRRFHHPNQHSNELSSFFCWKRSRSRIKPAEGGVPPVIRSTEVDESMKWPGAYASSGILFPIKEEDEREGAESDERCSSAEKETNNIISKTVFEVEWESRHEMHVIEVSVEDEATPFGTPIASPPLASPTRESL